MKAITGREALLRILQDEGVTHLFGNPGTTELPLMDALADFPQMNYVLAMQESVAMAMADGYARASGRLCAVNLHVAPGLGNAIGALYNARFFGSPVLVTAGQQEQGHSLTEPLLWGDLLAMAAPQCKWAVEVTRPQDLPRVVRRAAKVALTPPTGPVFLSLPGDVLLESAPMDLGASTRVDSASRPGDAALVRLAERLLAAKNPALIASHEVYTADALEPLAALAERLGAPVFNQATPYVAAFPTAHPLFMGELTRSQERVRRLLEPHDLLFMVGGDGLRMSISSPVEPLPEGMPILQIGTRDWELGKNYPTEQALDSDVKATLEALLPVLTARMSPALQERARKRAAAVQGANWQAQRRALLDKAATQEHAQPIRPEFLMRQIAQSLPPEGVMVEEGLTAARSLLGFLDVTHRHRFYGLASGGIGFAIAGAVGIKLALPERPLMAVIGDGSAMYSIQALWTAAHLKLPIAYVILNNGGYGIL
ncbi:MAG: thiamine pyrophosphate-binding protein, partial [Deltaproteobacteria bacterium]|nr:thiamine pyrophosphate-binding protein [Deltaproteobacteria bacterium]